MLDEVDWGTIVPNLPSSFKLAFLTSMTCLIPSTYLRVSPPFVSDSPFLEELIEENWAACLELEVSIMASDFYFEGTDVNGRVT
jgi:hypothetical protein